MWFKHRAWIPVAWALSLVNLAAVWFAARPGEPWHATTHALLAVLFGLGAQRLAHRKSRNTGAEVTGRSEEHEARPTDPRQLEDVEGRLAELEERLDFTERVLVDVRTRVQPPPKN
jgi:hypothetical protein